MRIILYTGKGGVGKTSVAAATGLRCAELGYRTLVMSADIAHSLADSFDLPLGAEPLPIADNLWGQEIDVEREVDLHWGTLQAWLRTLISWRGVDEVLAEEMAILPGMEELAGLIYVLNYYESHRFDVVIVDCAPSGETWRLLSFPDVLRWWMRRIFPLERVASRVIRPVLSRITDLPLPGDDVYEASQRLFERLDRMHAIMSDPKICTVRLVINPEKMVIKEAQRSFTYLNLYGYTTDMIVCNRILPDEISHSHFDAWKESQQKYLQQVEEAFSTLPIMTAPLMEQEIVGLEMLSRLAQTIYDDVDPSMVFYIGRTSQVDRDEGIYSLSIPLPFVSKEQISLSRSGDELLIQVGSYKRNLILPRMLVNMDLKDAKLMGNLLKVRFVPAEASKEV